MGRYRTWLMGAFMCLLVASLAVGEPIDAPEKPRKRPRLKQAEERPEGALRARRGRDLRPEARYRRGGGFVMRYLHNNEQFKAELKKHMKTTKRLHKRAQAIRQEVREKLHDPDLTPEEREEIVEEAKEDTAAILTKIVDEAIRHRKVVNRIIEANKEDIVEKTVERIFSRRRGQPHRPELEGTGEEKGEWKKPPGEKHKAGEGEESREDDLD